MSVGFTVVGFGMGLGFKMVMLQMRKLRLSSRAREEGGAEAVSGDAGLGAAPSCGAGQLELGAGSGVWVGGQAQLRGGMDARSGWHVLWRAALPALHAHAPASSHRQGLGRRLALAFWARMA